jgi:hypothetical protein
MQGQPKSQRNSSQNLGTARWWRFDRYELRDGFLRPASGASLESFDPWLPYWTGREGHVAEPPYAELATLVRDLPPIELTDARLLPDRAVSALLSWCSRNGLLGLMTHQVMWMRTVVPGKDGPRITTMTQSHQPWPAFNEVRPGWVPVQPLGPEALAIEIESIDPRPRPASLTASVGRFFADVNVEESEHYDYPAPLSDEFWHGYGELVHDVVYVMKYFGRLLERLSSDEDMSPTSGDPLLTKEAAAARLNALTKPTSIALEVREDGSFQLQWRSPSLLGHLANMAAQDLLGARRLYECPCGRFVTSGYPDTKYCSPEHREKYRKREQRRRAHEKHKT